jgi:uncharacterized protein YndB with AHSA1/START domain
MKILKYFFYTLLIIFLLFLANGFFASELNYEAEILVDAPPKKCWNVFTDTTKMAEWVLNFKSIETISETPNKVGSKYLMVVFDAGQEYEMTETVTEYNPGEYYSYELENDVLINNIDYSFEAIDGSTRIITTNKLIGKGLLMKSIFPFMKGMFTRQAEGDLINLKQLIENE